MDYILQFLLILLLVVLACTKTTIQSRMSRRHIRCTQDSVLFNAMMFAAIALCVAILFPMSAITPQIVGYAAMVAVSTTVFQTTYSVALSTGSVSLTVLIANFNVLITTASSVLIFKESLYYTQLIGILFLVASMFLSVDNSGDYHKVNWKWLALSVTAMVTSGLGSCIQKFFGRTAGASQQGTDAAFLFINYLLASLIAFAMYFIGSRFGKREKSTFGFNKHVLLYALATGLTLSIYQKFYMYGMAHIDGTFMFPTLAGASSVGMSIIGVVMFRDSLSKRQWLGILCGIACVALMNLRIGGFIQL
ncbi:MAG: EamA family transporter [Clostridia bacterium]|nr:EamA family transporter [Clostridia bacterium]